jgi:YfiH family protein
MSAPPVLTSERLGRLPGVRHGFFTRLGGVSEGVYASLNTGPGSAGVLCGALAADCAPVLVADSQARVAAAIHAGWRGALAGVVESAIAAMTTLGAAPERMVAAIGPCIGPASYEVGLEFLDAFVAASAANARFFAPGVSPQKRFFDLPAFVLSRLAAAGVAEAEWLGRDTYAEPDLFFSNRRAVHHGEADYGRLLSAIALAP